MFIRTYPSALHPSQVRTGSAVQTRGALPWPTSRRLRKSPAAMNFYGVLLINQLSKLKWVALKLSLWVFAIWVLSRIT